MNEAETRDEHYKPIAQQRFEAFGDYRGEADTLEADTEDMKALGEIEQTAKKNGNR